MLLFTLVTLGLTLLGNFGLLQIVLLDLRDSRTKFAFATYLAFIFLWTLGIFLNLWLESVTVEKCIFVAAAFLLTAQLWFVLTVTDEARPLPPLAYGAFAIGVLFALLSFMDGAMFSSMRITDAGYTILGAGTLSTYYSLFALMFVIAPVFIIERRRRTQSGTARTQQLNMLFYGYTIAAVVGVLTNSVLPVAFDIYFFNAIGPIFTLVLAGYVAYSINMHGFLDIRTIVQRGLGYILLFSFAFGCYLAILTILGYLLKETTGATATFAAGMTTLIGILGVTHFERSFTRLTDPVFFRDAYDFAAASRELSRIGDDNLDPQKLIAESSRAIMRILHASSVDFIITTPDGHEGGRELTSARDDMGMLVIPIISRARNLGSIVIGGKLSGEGYVRKDIDLVENFSTQFATAYEKAALYAKVAAYSEHLEQKVEERTLEVERLREEERQTMHDISHGLQTPLTILKNEIESLRQGSPGIPELAAVERSIDVTSKFVNDLLKLSRLELNQDAPLERLDLSELLLDLVEYIEIVAAEQNISIRSSIEDRCEVRGSGEELREAFTKVISNAVE